MAKINFNDITDNGKSPYLSGKKKGLAARSSYELDKLDETDEIVEIIIPNNVDCNISFISGLFSKSISNLGSRALFLNKYRFVEVPDKIGDILNDVISATLSHNTGLSSL